MWIWYLGDQTKLTWAELNALDALDFENRPFISDFSLWEIATLTSIKRLTLDRPLDRWLSMAAKPASVRILAVSVCFADKPVFFSAASNQSRGAASGGGRTPRSTRSCIANEVFFDTSGFFAVMDERDDLHQKAAICSPARCAGAALSSGIRGPGSIRVSRVVFGVSPNRVFRRDAGNCTRGRVRSPDLSPRQPFGN